MPEYLSPGVYVEEIDAGPVPIEGVSTSTAGFVGMTAQGPADGLPPVLVTSFSEYTRNFGGYLPASYGKMGFLPYAVQGFFENGGQRVYIKRVTAAVGDPKLATSQNIKGGLITRLSKDFNFNKNPGPGEDNKHVQLSMLRGIQAGTTLTFIQVKNGVTTTEPAAVPVDTYDDSTKTVILKTDLTNSYEARYTKVLTNRTPSMPQLSSDLKVDDTKAQLSTLRGVQASTKLTFTQAATTEQITVIAVDDTSKTVHWADAEKLKNNYDHTLTTVVSDTPPVVGINAINPGSWGNSLAIQIFQTSRGRAQVQAPGLVESVPKSGNYDTVLLNSASTFYPGAIVEFNKGNTKVYSKVKNVAGTNIVLNTPFTDSTELDPDLAGFTATIASTCEFRLTAANNGVVEDYPSLTLDTQTPYYFGNLINNQSSLITVTGSDDEGEDPFTMPSPDDGLNVIMGKGVDSSGTVTFNANDYIGVDNGPGQRTGIQALVDVDEISIIAAPGITDQGVINALIDQCTTLKYRFAILDPDYGAVTPLNDVETQRQLYDTHYAALYFPRVVNIDPNPASPAGSTIVLPPSGHIAGIYAGTDTNRGVYKAPANVVILGITDLDLTINKGEQDILNPPPYQINVLRNFRTQGRGLRVWGARCITSDAQWKYVNVRRLFMFVEKSLDQGTQWVVFEPNDYPLWARVTQSITNFLTTVWRDGALMGQKVEQAFFVRCDSTTMTQDDIDNGRLIVLVGIAPVKPAEFVIIRISQYTATASATGQ